MTRSDATHILIGAAFVLVMFMIGGIGGWLIAQVTK